MAAPQRQLRKHLSGDALIQLLHDEFQRIVPKRPTVNKRALTDALLSGFALFSLKDASLLAFDQRRHDDNLHSIYHIDRVPSDTHMRTLLDDVDTEQLRPAFQSVFRQIQRGKVLENMVYFQGCYLLSIDGSEHFSSTKIHCPSCLQRISKSGQVTYYHQTLSAAIIHPDCRAVIPVMPEPIVKQDGQNKNDCERNAAKRFLQHFRRDHPHLPVIVVEDGLSSNAPHIKELQNHKMHFILGVKSGDHKYLFEQMETAFSQGRVHTVTWEDRKSQVIYHFRYLLDVALNESNPDVRVNFLEYWEISATGIKYFSWVTDLELNADTVMAVMRGGRGRWKIENETFNTLKNQGYHFEHNFGHGEQNLCVIFMLLMMLAFLVDQVQQLCDPLFKAAWEKCGSKRQLWDDVRALFRSFVLSSLSSLYAALALGFVKGRLELENTS